MNVEPETIENFVAKRYLSARVQKIVEHWRVEADKIIEILVRHFREMGIFLVDRHQESLIIENMVHHLKHSPEIAQVVEKAQRDEMMRRRSRHSE